MTKHQPMSETDLFWTTLTRKITVYTGEKEVRGIIKSQKLSRNGLAKQDKADSYMWVTIKLS